MAAAADVKQGELDSLVTRAPRTQWLNIMMTKHALRDYTSSSTEDTGTGG